MTTEFIMPDGTHIRVNDEDADSMPEDWTRLGAVTDATQPITHASIQEEEKPKAKQAKAKVVKQPEA